MKRLIYILTLLTCLSTALPSFAVTEKEMDQARAIATKAYLRYANDGSGYLDDINPKSMAELEKALKAKEKENIKAFKSIPVPKDYASWDKEKLVEYWSTKAFSSKGLIEKGRIGKKRAKKNLNAMKIAAPVKQPETKVESQDNKQESSVAPAATTKQDNTPTPDNTQKAENIPAESVAADTASNTTAADPLSDPLFADIDADTQISKAKDHTWIYIVILCVLVAVVVGLVVFASNVMKKNSENYKQQMPSPLADNSSKADANTLREKFAATLTAKNEEIATLSKKVESLNAQNISLKSNLEGLTAEVASLRTRISEANKKIADYESGAQRTEHATTQAEPRQQEANRASTRQATSQPAASDPSSRQPSTPGVRSIFLGRANAKGIFVRADRTLNPGNSIFRLDTTDGYAGSFRVVSNPTVWEMAMLSPMESLAGACVAPDIANTDGMTKVVNDSAGTAIFEGGCWKVIRKAKIHFE